MTGRRGRSRKQLLDDLKEEKILEIERGSTRSHRVENSFWKRLRTCRKTDCRMKRLRTCRKTDCRMSEWSFVFVGLIINTVTCFHYKVVIFRPLKFTALKLQLRVHFCMGRLRSQYLGVTVYRCHYKMLKPTKYMGNNATAKQRSVYWLLSKKKMLLMCSTLTVWFEICFCMPL
jgi:hypothetical protein